MTDDPVTPFVVSFFSDSTVLSSRSKRLRDGGILVRVCVEIKDQRFYMLQALKRSLPMILTRRERAEVSVKRLRQGYQVEVIYDRISKNPSQAFSL